MRILGPALASIALIGVLASPAHADDPTPAPSPVPSETTPAPTPSSTPTVEPTPTGKPTVTPSPSTQPTPSSTPTTTPSNEHNDGTSHSEPTPPPSIARPQPGPYPTQWQLPRLDFGSDPRLVAQARAKLQEVRRLLQAAEQELADAQEAADQALEQARQARWEALLARVRAEQAQRVLQQHASGVYRSDGGVASLVRIVDGALESPADVLDEQAYLEQASRVREDQVEQARIIVSQAAQAVANAAAAELAATQAVANATAAEKRMSSRLEQARTELSQVLAMPVGSQTLIGPNGCPTTVPEGTMRGTAATLDPYELCRRSVRAAATPEAALAIKYLFRALGAPYACDGVGRTEPYRYDCSSLAARAYAEGAGLATAGPGWAPSTRDMVPWDGIQLSPWYGYVEPKDARPGDLFLYDTGGDTYRHVVILMADGYMIHTNACGDVAKVEPFWGAGVNGAQFIVARRILPDKARIATEPAPKN